MTLEEAKKLLNTCHREALNDHALGDSEVNWYIDASNFEPGALVAGGYFGSHHWVGIWLTRDQNTGAFVPVTERVHFEGDEARTLQYCGLTSSSHRNDSGPY